MAEAANDDFGQAMELVEKAFRGLRPHLYCRDEGGRRSFYAILLGELCDLLTIDGGPTHARIALEIGVKNMRADEERRGSTELAPFLTPEECKGADRRPTPRSSARMAVETNASE